MKRFILLSFLALFTMFGYAGPPGMEAKPNIVEKQIHPFVFDLALLAAYAEQLAEVQPFFLAQFQSMPAAFYRQLPWCIIDDWPVERGVKNIKSTRFLVEKPCLNKSNYRAKKATIGFVYLC